jgi:hypothetical protein
MGGECFRYCRLKANVVVTDKENRIYQELLSSIMSEVKLWFAEQNSEEWVAIFDGEHAVELQVKEREYLEGIIVLPKELNHSLNVGWQHRKYGSIRDPKYEIATIIMNLLLKSDLKSLIDEYEEDNILSDLGMYDYDYGHRYDQSKGPLHYACGIPDDCWSPDGLYGGYHDYEDYLDANGIEYHD